MFKLNHSPPGISQGVIQHWFPLSFSVVHMCKSKNAQVVKLSQLGTRSVQSLLEIDCKNIRLLKLYIDNRQLVLKYFSFIFDLPQYQRYKVEMFSKQNVFHNMESISLEKYVLKNYNRLNFICLSKKSVVIGFCQVLKKLDEQGRPIPVWTKLSWYLDQGPSCLL